MGSEERSSRRNADTIAAVDVGDTIHIAWIDDGVLKTEAFEIEALEYGLRPYFELKNESRYAFMVGNFRQSHLITGISMFQTVSVSTTSDGLDERIQNHQSRQQGDQ